MGPVVPVISPVWTLNTRVEHFTMCHFFQMSAPQEVSFLEPSHVYFPSKYRHVIGSCMRQDFCILCLKQEYEITLIQHLAGFTECIISLLTMR